MGQPVPGRCQINAMLLIVRFQFKQSLQHLDRLGMAPFDFQGHSQLAAKGGLRGKFHNGMSQGFQEPDRFPGLANQRNPLFFEIKAPAAFLPFIESGKGGLEICRRQLTQKRRYGVE